jgi:prevent-host-death family protein
MANYRDGVEPQYIIAAISIAIIAVISWRTLTSRPSRRRQLILGAERCPPQHHEARRFRQERQNRSVRVGRVRHGQLAPVCLGATMSHMQVSIRELRNRTGDVVAAVQAGEPVTLTSRGEPIADIVPHRRRARWLPGTWLGGELAERQADAALRSDLDRLAGGTIDEL